MFQTDYVRQHRAVSVPGHDLHQHHDHRCARRRRRFGNGKSGFGIWANPLPEAGQGPAVGSVTFNHLVESDNDVDIQNTSTSTFTITVNP